jgi:hypothetical protein
VGVSTTRSRSRVSTKLYATSIQRNQSINQSMVGSDNENEKFGTGLSTTTTPRVKKKEALGARLKLVRSRESSSTCHCLTSLWWVSKKTGCRRRNVIKEDTGLIGRMKAVSLAGELFKGPVKAGYGTKRPQKRLPMVERARSSLKIQPHSSSSSSHPW